MNLISKVDYTLLNPSATEAEIVELCKKAHNLGVKSVCVRPNMVSVAKKELFKSDILVCTVISFPDGADSTEDKLEETKKAIYNGADECDMVLNYTKLLTPDLGFYNPSLVYDVERLVDECHRHTNKDGDKITLKVIVESGVLDEDQTKEATEICILAGADFIKTSTGFASNGKGAELNKVQIMKNIISEAHSHMKIKASGGIRTMSDVELYEPYVDRFGVGFAAVDSIFGEETMSENSY
jgi:deoxyribose-phosphate aldolase